MYDVDFSDFFSAWEEGLIFVLSFDNIDIVTADTIAPEGMSWSPGPGGRDITFNIVDLQAFYDSVGTITLFDEQRTRYVVGLM